MFVPRQDPLRRWLLAAKRFRITFSLIQTSGKDHMRLPPRLTALLANVEAATLIVVLLFCGAIWAFLGIAEEMSEGELHAFDEAVLMAFRTPGDPTDPMGGSAVETIMRDLTALGGSTVIVLISSFIFLYLMLSHRRASALLLAGAVIGGIALSTVMKIGFDRPRPDLVPHSVEVMTASFPSGHSMMSAVTYLTLAVMMARTEKETRLKVFHIAAAMLVIFLVGISRIYLGVHWPSDVLAGWTLGAAWALGVSLLARYLERRGEIEPDEGHPVDSPSATG